MRTILFNLSVSIIFVLTSCKQSSSSEYLWEGSQKSVQFLYDPIRSEDPKLISDLVQENGQVCFVSGEDPNFRISICIKEEKISEFEKVLSAWKEGALVPEFGSTLSDNSEYRIGTYLFSGIKKKLEDPKFAIVGDRKLRSIGSGTVLWDRSNINLKNHLKTFSIFFLSNGASFLILPPFGGSEVFLGIYLKAPNLENEIQNLVRTKNQIGLETCKFSLPIITEIFGETNSNLGRWIEIYNPNGFPICEEGLEFNLFGNKAPIPVTTGFISAHETRIYAEDSASLERLSLLNLKWGDLKKYGKILLSRLDQSVEFNLPGTEYLFGETYYSWNGSSFSRCEIISKFCMDPGENPAYNLETESDCDPNDFEIEEINPNGLVHNGTLQSDWKYLDLVYRGNKVCDPSSLMISWGKNLFPIKISKKIQADELLSIGNLPFLLGNPFYSPASFQSVTPSELISLSDSFGKEKVLWDGNFRTSKGVPTRIVLQKTNGETVSICFENGQTFLHQNTSIAFSNASLRTNLPQFSIYAENPRTSAGRKFCHRQEVESKVQFSEVSWMGSYQGVDPISKDRFLEFVSVSESSPSSAYLEIIQSNGTLVSILLPLEKESPTVLSSGKSVCFPHTEFWKDASFSLPSSGSNLLKISDPHTGELWDEFTYSSTGPGVNDTRNKVRKSANSKIESGVRVWSISSYSGRPFRDSNCSLTEAHPGILE
ncbi:LIC11755 family lipoprotein [Leptospira licerasiae]|uniref:LIC11755 family lipoprotein n=1 Tax=Leptospira licerasiae TaxID=447106 RepID=UPI003017F098